MVGAMAAKYIFGASQKASKLLHPGLGDSPNYGENKHRLPPSCDSLMRVCNETPKDYQETQFDNQSTNDRHIDRGAKSNESFSWGGIEVRRNRGYIASPNLFHNIHISSIKLDYDRFGAVKHHDDHCQVIFK